MKCPNCKSVSIVKNGCAPSGKMRWKCSKCKKTFDKDTGKNYPPTTIPFPFIAYVLSVSKGNSLEKTKRQVNIWLQQFPICSKKTISKSAVYKWKNNYGKTYTKLISKAEIKRYRDHYLKLSKDCYRKNKKKLALK